MDNLFQFMQATDHHLGTPVLIALDKVAAIFPIPEIEQLSSGKTAVVMANGLRLTLSESYDEVYKKLYPTAH